MERTFRISRSVITATLTVLASVLLAGWMARNSTIDLVARVERAENKVAQATEKMSTADAQLQTNREHIEQLIRDQRVRSDRDAERRATEESELRDMRSEVKMLRQAVFTMRPTARSRRR
jgi:hypothetical protein